MRLLLLLVLSTNLFAASNAPIAARGVNKYLDFPQQSAAPANPAASHNRVYTKTLDDTHLYLLGSDGTETALGSSGGGITSINGDTTALQTFGVGSAGTDFALTTSAGATTINLPAASATAAGKVTTGAQTIAGAKTFSTPPAYSSLTASTVPYLNGSKQLASSAITPTELGYLSGVSSSVQSQLDAKQNALTTGNLTASGGVTQSGGTGAVIGAGVSISCTASADGTAGCMTGSDHTSFTGLHVEQLDGQIDSPSNKTYYLRFKAKYSGTINELSVQTASGTITAAIQINSVNVTGLSSVSVSSTPQTVSATSANTFAAGDTITMVTSSNSSAADLVWSLKTTRN